MAVVVALCTAMADCIYGVSTGVNRKLSIDYYRV